MKVLKVWSIRHWNSSKLSSEPPTFYNQEANWECYLSSVLFLCLCYLYQYNELLKQTFFFFLIHSWFCESRVVYLGACSALHHLTGTIHLHSVDGCADLGNSWKLHPQVSDHVAPTGGLSMQIVCLAFLTGHLRVGLLMQPLVSKRDWSK